MKIGDNDLLGAAPWMLYGLTFLLVLGIELCR
jgi:hypothetical protein